MIDRIDKIYIAAIGTPFIEDFIDAYLVKRIKVYKSVYK